jgi:hypothetical protein
MGKFINILFSMFPQTRNLIMIMEPNCLMKRVIYTVVVRQASKKRYFSLPSIKIVLIMLIFRSVFKKYVRRGIQ